MPTVNFLTKNMNRNKTVILFKIANYWLSNFDCFKNVFKSVPLLNCNDLSFVCFVFESFCTFYMTLE